MNKKSNIKKNIEKVAKNLFLKKGYKETKILDISKELGISPTTIYLYFKNKKELFDSLKIPEVESLQPTHDKKRSEILHEALLLFGERGFDGTSMNMIADRVNLSKTALYQYFKDKNDLFSKVLKELPFHFNFLNEKYKNINKENLDLETIVLDVAKSYLAIFDSAERIAFTRTVFSDSVNYPEISNMYHEQSIGYASQYLENILKEFKYLLIENLDYSLAASSYIGSLFSFSVQYKIIGLSRKYTDETFLQTTTEIFLRGILK